MMNSETTPSDSNTTAMLIRAQDTPALDVFGTQVTVLGGAAQTAGVFSLARIVCPPGTGAPPHTHLEMEHFHVLRGRLAVQREDEQLELLPGDTIHIPSGVAHAFANHSEDEAEFIAAATPGGHERFFREADELSRSGRFNPQTAGELCERNGITLV